MYKKCFLISIRKTYKNTGMEEKHHLLFYLFFKQIRFFLLFVLNGGMIIECLILTIYGVFPLNNVKSAIKDIRNAFLIKF